MISMKSKRILVAICLLLISATMLGTASFAWFSMNTEVSVDGIEVEAYSDSLFLEISKKNATEEFATSVTLSDSEEQILRLAKHGFAGSAYTLVIDDSITGNFAGETDAYYEVIEETADSYQKLVKATLQAGTPLAGLYKNLEFTKITVNTSANGTDTYYEMNGGKYTPVVPADGDEVKGMYTLDTVAPAPESSGNYAGGADEFFYFNDADDSYSDVTSTLELGTDLSDYVKVTTTPVTLANATGDVYLAKTGTASDEYAFLGTFAGEDITNLLYFGRAYSDVIDNGDLGDTLSIIKDTSLESYRYAETIWLRNALNTNDSKNLKAEFKIGGAENNLASALRVLLVVSDVKTGKMVNVVYYANGDNPETNGVVETGYTTYGLNATDDNIVDVLLGNTAETLKVDIYVYFDGTDPIAENVDIPAGILDGQTVEIKFTIDNHDYND